jgi:hypothetical protein
VEKVLQDIALRSGKPQRVVLTSHQLSADLSPAVEKSLNNKKHLITERFSFYWTDYSRNAHL